MINDGAGEININLVRNAGEYCKCRNIAGCNNESLTEEGKMDVEYFGI